MNDELIVNTQFVFQVMFRKVQEGCKFSLRLISKMYEWPIESTKSKMATNI